MHAVVTGASGLIGSHLCDRLIKEGYQVMAILRPTSSTQYLKQDKQLKVIRCANEDLKSIISEIKRVDLFFHNAGFFQISSPFTADEDFQKYQSINVDQTKIAVNVAIEAAVRRFVFTSSVAVYSNTESSPISESAKLEPPSAYGRSKVMAEEIVREANDRGLETTIIRPSLVYGPRDRHYGKTMETLGRLPIVPLVGGGNNLIDFAYVADVIEVMWLASQQDIAINQVYNACSGSPVSVVGLLQSISNASERRMPMVLPVPERILRTVSPLMRLYLSVFAPGLSSLMSSDGITYMGGDIYYSMDLVKNDLHFSPKFSVEEGMMESFSITNNINNKLSSIFR